MVNKDDIIAELRELVEKQARQIDALTREVAQLKLQLAKANKDSSNSSKSPSSDITNAGKDKKKKKPGRPKKRTIGGQPGHSRKLREPLPPDRIDEVIDHEIDPKEIDRLQLTATEQFETIQHIELPDTPVIVTEHRFRLYQDSNGDLYYQHDPDVHGQPIFGPRLLATLGWMKSKAHCSYSTIEQYCNDVLNIPVSRGYLSKLCTGVISASLAVAYEEAKAAIPDQPQLGSDETSILTRTRFDSIECRSQG